MPNKANSLLSQGSTSTSSGGGITSLLSAVSNPIASIANYFFGKSLSDRRNEQAIAQWQRENEYNLPSNQLKRLRDAGLSPALMYENGASGLVSAASPELSKSQSSIQGVDPLTAAQIRNLDAQTRSIDDANTRENQLQPFRVENVDKNNRVLAKHVELMTAQEQESYAHATLMDAEREIKTSTADALLESMKADAKLKDAVAEFNIEQTKQMVGLYNLKKQGLIYSNFESLSRIGLNNAEYRRLEKVCDLIDSEIDLNRARSLSTTTSTMQHVIAFPLEMRLKNASAQLQSYQAQDMKERSKTPGFFGEAYRTGKGMYNDMKPW